MYQRPQLGSAGCTRVATSEEQADERISPSFVRTALVIGNPVPSGEIINPLVDGNSLLGRQERSQFSHPIIQGSEDQPAVSTGPFMPAPGTLGICVEDRAANQSPNLGGVTPFRPFHDVGGDPGRGLIVQPVRGVGDHLCPVQVQHPRLQRVQNSGCPAGHLHRLGNLVLRRPTRHRQDQTDLVSHELPERTTRGGRAASSELGHHPDLRGVRGGHDPFGSGYPGQEAILANT